MSTYTKPAAALGPNCRSRVSIPHSGRRSMPQRLRAGSSTAACTTMPNVVPSPSSRISGLNIFTGASGSIRLPMSAYSESVPMATTLLHTGAQAAGLNTSL